MRRRIAAVLALSLVPLGGLLDAGPAAASTKTALQCPSGYTCLYRPGGLDGSPPAYEFYTYGYHNLANMTGQGALVENENGGANVGTYWCAGFGGTGKILGSASGPNDVVKGYTVHDPLNLTPINSVILTHHWSETPPTTCNSVKY